MLAVALILVSAVVYVVWNQVAQNEAVEGKVLAEARTLNTEMSAVWDYVDAQQNAINYNSDGRYDFKGIYCSVAGKAIALRFTRNSEGYVVRYVREDPRTPTDEPDEFEAAALASFEEGETEYYGIVATDDGSGSETKAFRYVSVLRYTYGCLDCHGEPAGEPDETNYPREGKALGDIAGAVSISIPMESYEQEAFDQLVRSVLFFGVMTLAAVLLLRAALHRWVMRPLEQANAVLREDNEAKSDFLAVMSHELRTPLSSIMAFTDIWERRARERAGGGAGSGGAGCPAGAGGSGEGSAPDAEDARLVGEIRENSRMLLDMVNNTIDVEKLEQGRFKIDVDEIDLFDAVDSVCAALGPLAARRGVLLVRDLDPATPIALADWEALRKILVNLVGNALKFTEAGGTVTVGTRPSPAEGRVELFVADTGIGIPEEDRERVFGKFDQSVFRTAASSQGSGLGLFLVRTLAERLGGCVRLESELGAGSTFTVDLPACGAADDLGGEDE